MPQDTTREEVGRSSLEHVDADFYPLEIVRTEWIINILGSYAVQLPAIIAYVAGIGVSVAFWGRYPRAAKLAFSGCLLLLLVQLVFVPLHVLVLMVMLVRGAPAGDVGPAVAAVSVARSLFYLVGFGLLLAAVVVGRGQRVPADGQPLDSKV